MDFQTFNGGKSKEKHETFENGGPRRPKRWMKRLGYVFIFIILVLFIGLMSVQYLTDYIWMETLGFASVYTTILSSKIMLGVIGFLIFALATYITLAWIRRSYLNHFDHSQLPKVILSRKIATLLILVGAIIVGLLGSSITQGVGWERTLKFLHHASFGTTDPHFHLDISFYIFVLPFIEFIVYLLLGLGIFLFLIEIGAYSVFHMYRMNRLAQFHLGITLAIIGVLLACNHFLQPFETLLTDHVNMFQKSAVHGLSYTDDLINIPKSYIMAAVALFGTVWMIISLVRGRLRAMIIPVIAYVGLFVVGQVASVVVQSFIVSPNEFTKEKPYLAENLKYTRMAYDIDDIEEKKHPGNYSLDDAMVKRNDQTISNIRMNDAKPLLDVYNQLQTFRTYYEFNGVDMDRYKIDGKYQQVFLGARELNMKDLPEQAKTWTNRNLRYTHGYGIVMSHVNEVTPQGQPEYMEKNLPPKGALDIKRPQIYFGEENYQNVIVDSKVKEFDYPSGDENAESRFDADTGISLSGINRLLFAINEGSLRMFTTDQITSKSQLLDTRNIMDRVNRIAPFFSYDSDPYIVVRDDGTLVWIIDAYLSAERYPYSEPYKKHTNYMRNPVKVMVDAYTGEVNFYVVDDSDPLLKTFANIFPDLFTTDVPDDIRAHFRYPVTLFKVQSAMYGTYHMSNLEVFYNREDYWQFPTEKYYDEDVTMDPYYITMKLPDKDKAEFILMMPFTPKKRQNMVSWMGVRNDGDHYGEKFVYRFPKQKNIYGPQQIENRINQNDQISKQLNLWSQGGSKVIRGNLLAIPIEDTLLYVEPIYIESANETALPEVKRVVLAYGDYIVMEKSFDQSLKKILSIIDNGGKAPEKQTDKDGKTEKQDQTDDKDLPLTDAGEQLQSIAKLFDSYQKAVSEGDWEKAGKVMSDIQAKLKDVQ